MRRFFSGLLLLGSLTVGTTAAQAQMRSLNIRNDRGLEADLADQRLLRNVEPFLNATALLNRLRPVRYNIQSPLDPQLMGPLRIGFVAQQVIPVLPGLVRRDYDMAGTLRMDYAQLVPVLTRALQEQDVKLNLLSAELAAMNKEVVQLRAANSRVALVMATKASAAPDAGSGARVAQLEQQVQQLQAAVGQLQLLARQLTAGR